VARGHWQRLGAVPDRAIALLEVDQAVVVVLAGPKRTVHVVLLLP